MVRIEHRHELARTDADAVESLVADAATFRGYRTVPDQLWLQVRAPANSAVHLVAIDDRDGSTVVGYAQLDRGHESCTLGVVVPFGIEDRQGVVASLASAALHQRDLDGGATLRWWVLGDDHDADEVAASLGFGDVRLLRQLRVPLPLPAHGSGAAVSVRPFRQGTDEPAWLEVNNAAFAWHAEQGGWTRATLDQREREEWFDPAGFLLHEIEGRLAAFCWTKVHSDTTPALGEIYVIAVHPDFHGRGLGRALTEAGLDHLWRRGIGTGMLYVDAANTAAAGLYHSMGFTTFRTDRAHVMGAAPASDASSSSRTGDRR